MFQNLKLCETRLYHIPLALVYRCNDERSEKNDGEDGSEISGGRMG